MINLFEQQLKNLNQEENIKIIRNFNIEFLNILESPSVILRGKSRIWKLIRGIYNNQFNNLFKKKEETNLIKRLWRFTYNEIKNQIWIPRCDEIKRLEEKENIKKTDLRKRKIDQKDNLDKNKGKRKLKKTKTEDNIEKTNKNKLEKNIKLATLTKLKGKIVDRINIDNIWDMTVKIANYID